MNLNKLAKFGTTDFDFKNLLTEDLSVSSVEKKETMLGVANMVGVFAKSDLE